MERILHKEPSKSSLGIFRLRVTVIIVVLFALGIPFATEKDAPVTSGPIVVDTVVYGGTPSGVSASIAAAIHGMRVVLISAEPTVGGAISNGLGATDIGNSSAVSGIARQFLNNISAHYKFSDGWRTEPHVAEEILRGMLSRHDIEVVTEDPLMGAQLNGKKISCISLADSRSYCGSVFIDASYEGDLLAAAGATFHLGRSDIFAYHEPVSAQRRINTVVKLPSSKSDAVTILKRNPYIRFLKSVPRSRTQLPQGEPSMGWRLCLSPTRKVAFTPGSDYARYLPYWRLITKTIYSGEQPDFIVQAKSNGTRVGALFHFSLLPDGSYDLNSGSFDLLNVPIPKRYFTDASSRPMVTEQFRNYLESLLYFIQNDAQAPVAEREFLRGMGLCAHEFTDNGNWPYQPYVREGRRLVGLSTVTTNDMFHHRTKPDSVALGSYWLDNKAGFLVYAQKRLYRDAGPYLKAPPFEIAYSTMLPKSGPSNLLVSVGISSSPLAYGAIRVEVQYMQLGQAAGTAAALAKRQGGQVADISVVALKNQLEFDGDTTSLVRLCWQTPKFERHKFNFDSSTCAALQAVPHKPGRKSKS